MKKEEKSGMDIENKQIKSINLNDNSVNVSKILFDYLLKSLCKNGARFVSYKSLIMLFV